MLSAASLVDTARTIQVVQACQRELSIQSVSSSPAYHSQWPPQLLHSTIIVGFRPAPIAHSDPL